MTGIVGLKMQKTLRILVSAIIMVSTLGVQQASSFGLGSATRSAVKQSKALYISTKARSLEPFAYVLFCTRQPSECAASSGVNTVSLTATKRQELKNINARINRQIRPRNDIGALGGDEWTLAPKAGDCEDYAITKRHELIRKGWPAAALRLAVAHTAWGEGHLVLVVRTNEGDLVLDSLSGRIKNWRQTNLKWEMIQATGNPRIWHRI